MIIKILVSCSTCFIYIARFSLHPTSGQYPFHKLLLLLTLQGKGKAIPLQACTGLEGSRRL